MRPRLVHIAPEDPPSSIRGGAERAWRLDQAAAGSLYPEPTFPHPRSRCPAGVALDLYTPPPRADTLAAHAYGSDAPTKAVFCARGYDAMPGLYDVLFLQGSVSRAQEAHIIHFTLAGTTRELAQKFTQRFVETGAW